MKAPFSCECGVNLKLAKYPVHCSCGKRHASPGVVSTGARTKPYWVSALSIFRSPEDTGPGDTAKRLLAEVGGEKFKALTAKMGLPCKCDERQAEWNANWPY